MLTSKMLQLVEAKLIQVRYEVNQNVDILLNFTGIANECENLLGISIPSQEQYETIRDQLKGKIVSSLTSYDLTVMLDAQNLKKLYRDSLEISDYITAKSLLDKSKDLTICAQHAISQTLEDYANVLSVERNQIASSSRSQIAQLDQQLYREKNSTDVANKSRGILWIIFGVIALFLWIGLLATSSNGLWFIWYLIVGAFGIAFYALFWGIGTEIVARVISSIDKSGKKAKIQGSISHVNQKINKTLSSLEKREETLKKAKQILFSYVESLKS